ncbi:MAG: tRNA(Ile)-lysidine synthetase [Anaerolineae bacterium]
MRCRTCGAPAVINMRQHKLSLCAEHYPPWVVNQTERTIRKYHMFTSEERILVAVSGGKDSLALWDVLLKLGYKADGLYIDLGIDGGFGYSASSREKVVAFQEAHPETRLHIVDITALYGESIIDVAQRKRRSSRPCSICGVLKRHEMNRIALEEGYDVLATGHNLDDEAATLFGNVLHWQVGYLRRQGPVLPADDEGFVRKVKPFCRFYERETAAYALVTGIDYIYAECPYAVGATTIRHKKQLAAMEHESPGTKLHFYTNFLRAKEEGLINTAENVGAELHPCTRCGQPTAGGEICRFCRLWS